MYTLFISTYGKFINIALLKDNDVLTHLIKESVNSHSIHTMPMIKEILETNNITTKNLGEIAVVCGPGSFTGVRIGVTIAKTLSYALKIPIKTISSLECIAISAEKNKKLATIRDIKGVYYGLFDEYNNLLEPLNYFDNKEFNEFVENYSYQNILIEESNLDIKKIHEYLKNVKPIHPHEVKPIYIKKIEVEK